MPLKAAPDGESGGSTPKHSEILTIPRHLKSYLKCIDGIQFCKCPNEERRVLGASDRELRQVRSYDVRHRNFSRADGFVLVHPSRAALLF